MKSLCSSPLHTPSASLSSCLLQNMTTSGGDGGSRVSIPSDLLETIQNIREITGKQHSDEDIFSVFKDCFSDPYETAQKLLYLDTFHEVKRKRERKKENLLPSTQERGRNGRRNFASIYAGANDGSSAAFRRQSRANHIVGGSRNASPAPNQTTNDTIPCSIKAPNPISPPTRVSNHKAQDVLVSPVNKGVSEEQPLSKSTSSSEDVSELEKSKASESEPVSDSIVQNDTQYAEDGTSQNSQQSSTSAKQDHLLIATSNCGSSQSDQVTRSVAVANEGNNRSLLKSDVVEGSHGANCDDPPISYPDQCSIAATQQAMHLFRQQYPLIFFPYGPYYPHIYMAQPYIHQFLSPNQKQSSPAPPGVKVPLHDIKPGTNIENSPPTTFPSPYDSYAAAFYHIPSAATPNSTHKEEKKENIHTTEPLSLANLQASAMYNLSLQSQPLAFPNLQAAFTGIYQQTQPILAAPTIFSMTEQPIGLLYITHQQPQAALTNLGDN